MKKTLIIGLVALLFMACNKEDIQSNYTYVIDEELQPYFDLFVMEGEARGIVIDLEEGKIEGLMDVLDRGVVGECWYSSSKPHTVTIDLFFWKRANELEKEYVVFHELGHCYLGLLHDDTANSDGSCKSIMESGTGLCYTNYQYDTRESYLDELFFK